MPEAGEGEPMRVIYRMRGLLGDATEEFIESLDKKVRDTPPKKIMARSLSVRYCCQFFFSQIFVAEKASDFLKLFCIGYILLISNVYGFGICHNCLKTSSWNIIPGWSIMKFMKIHFRASFDLSKAFL